MKKLYLNESDKKICGVCSGIAEALDLDPSMVRLAFVAMALCTGGLPMVIFYIIARAIIPKRI